MWSSGQSYKTTFFVLDCSTNQFHFWKSLQMTVNLVRSQCKAIQFESKVNPYILLLLRHHCLRLIRIKPSRIRQWKAYQWPFGHPCKDVGAETGRDATQFWVIGTLKRPKTPHSTVRHVFWHWSPLFFSPSIVAISMLVGWPAFHGAYWIGTWLEKLKAVLLNTPPLVFIPSKLVC